MNVSRRTLNGQLNPYEKINTQVIYSTSAGSKSSYAYGALIDIFERSIMDPSRNACFGIDYHIPTQHGLIDPNYVKKLKLSPSYNETTFAAEYGGQWIAGTDESWFNFEKMQKYRIKKNPEWNQKFIGDKNVFYLIATDVGRIGCATIVSVFRVNIKNNKYHATLVYMEELGRTAQSKQFSRQAIDLKKIIMRYNPREVVIDTNGIGVGLGDEMIKPHYDEAGNYLPPFGFHNDDEYKKTQPKDAICILYGIKANQSLNSKIHGNVYSRMSGGLVKLLITEQEAKTALLATKQGAAMSYEKKIKRLLPHEQTSKLIQEMANLRLRQTGLDIILEQINSRFPKDRYSSFSYGLWRIKELEDASYKKQRRFAGIGNRSLVFFSGV